MGIIDEPLCSVIVPAYNCVPFIRDSLLSVLTQSYSNLEVLVVDDCSTDKTSAIISEMADCDNRIRHVKNSENVGVAATRNRGFSLARGKYIALLDADDVWLPYKLELQLSLMTQSGCDICYTSYSLMDKQGVAIKKPYIVPENVSFSQLIKENVIGCSTAVFKAELTERFSMRSEYAHEDYVFWLELLRQGCTARGLAEPLVRYRILRGSRSENKLKAAKNRWYIYRSFLNLGRFEAAGSFINYSLMGIKKHL